jgi:hypothetical protein
MQPFVITPEFARAVWDDSVVHPGRTIVACARIVSTEWWLLRDAAQLCGEFEFTEVFDPASAWWLPLHDESGLGVHFWRLVNQTIELRSVSSLEASPELYFGRFAERESGESGTPQSVSPKRASGTDGRGRE